MRTVAFVLLSLPLVACAPGKADQSAGGDTTSALSGVYKTTREVLELAREAGLPCDEHAVIATAIAYAESSFDIHAINYNTNDTYDYGLWQINTVHGLSESYLFNSTNNATAMYDISGGGQDWTPWATYNSGAYEQYTQDAWDAWGKYNCQ
jgi:hypothetical protein